MKELIEVSYDSLIEFCESGKYYTYYKIEPNNGVFDKDFLLKFIDLVKHSDYSSEYEILISRGCDKAVKNLKKFTKKIRNKIIDECGLKENGYSWNLNEELIINIIKSLNEIINYEKMK